MLFVCVWSHLASKRKIYFKWAEVILPKFSSLWFRCSTLSCGASCATILLLSRCSTLLAYSALLLSDYLIKGDISMASWSFLKKAKIVELRCNILNSFISTIRSLRNKHYRTNEGLFTAFAGAAGPFFSGPNFLSARTGTLHRGLHYSRHSWNTLYSGN